MMTDSREMSPSGILYRNLEGQKDDEFHVFLIALMKWMDPTARLMADNEVVEGKEDEEGEKESCEEDKNNDNNKDEEGGGKEPREEYQNDDDDDEDKKKSPWRRSAGRRSDESLGLL